MKVFKNLLMFSLLLFGSLLVNGQVWAPNGFNYQMVLRNGAGELVTSGNVALRFTLYQGGNTIFQETHTVPAGEYGQVSVVVGTGTATTGTYSSVSFGDATTTMQVEVDPNGGSNYTDIGTSEIRGVPLANISKASEFAGTAGVAVSANAVNGPVNATSFSHSAGGATLNIFPGVRQGQANATFTTIDMAGINGTVLVWDNFVVTGNLGVDGNVGIRGAATAVPLEVSGTGGFFSNTGVGFLNTAGAGTTNSSRSYTARFNGDVSAELYIATSDRRIKTDLSIGNSTEDLALINKLEVTSYRFIDSIQKGDMHTTGFIAQQVKEVMPEAVSITSNYIPNIYAMSENFEALENGSYKLRLAKAYKLQAGDKVKVFTKDAHELEVNAIVDDKTVIVSGKLPDNVEQVFVYGQQVDDFHSVDYNQIFSTGISAIQELSKQVETLKAENAGYKADISLIKEHLGLDLKAEAK